MGIVRGFVEHACLRGDLHLLHGFAAPKSGDHLCPQQARRAQFGDFDKEVPANGKCKLHARGDGFQIEAACQQCPQIIHTRRQSKGQFLDGVPPAVVIGHGADRHRCQPGRVFGSPRGEQGHFVIGAFQGQRQGALLNKLGQRVRADAALQVCQRQIPVMRAGRQQRRHRERVGARLDEQRIPGKLDPLEKLRQIIQRVDMNLTSAAGF